MEPENLKMFKSTSWCFVHFWPVHFCHASHPPHPTDTVWLQSIWKSFKQANFVIKNIFHFPHFYWQQLKSNLLGNSLDSGKTSERKKHWTLSELPTPHPPILNHFDTKHDGSSGWCLVSFLRLEGWVSPIIIDRPPLPRFGQGHNYTTPPSCERQIGQWQHTSVINMD